MKNQLLKLIKGLNRFKIDDLCQMAELQEEEITCFLDEFLKEGIIAKTGNNTFTMLDKIPQRQSKRPKNVLEKRREESKKLLDFSQKEIEEYKRAPDWAKKSSEKYIKIMYATQNMNYKAIEQFLKNWNRENPDQTASISGLNRMKRRLKEEGLTGLLAKYNPKNKGDFKAGGAVYERFKELYLVPSAPSLKYCYRQVREEMGHLYENWNFPCSLSFRRKLKNEFTDSEIESLRNPLNFELNHFIENGLWIAI